MLPNDYPCWQTIYGYFNSWSKADVWEKINVELVKQVRKKTKKANHKKNFARKSQQREVLIHRALRLLR
jgi:transposase